MTTTQLRLFTIDRGRLEDFAKAWLAGVYPLRRAQGYRIEQAGVIEQTNQFVWLVEYDGDDFEEKEREYYSSAERAALDPDPAQWIARAEAYLVRSVLPES